LVTFLNSPLLGAFSTGDKSYNVEGGHIYWMNKLAVMGILGFIFFIQIYYRNISFYIKTIANQEFKLYYLLSVVSFITYGLIKNIGGREAYFMLFFILPSMQFLPLLKTKKNEK
jgi:hypothetical protein